MDSILMGKFIAEKRKALELTQNDLAQKLGVEEKVVMKWEEKNVLPKNELILPLCEVLGVSVNELVAGTSLQENEFKENSENNALKYVKSQNDLKLRRILELVVIATTLLSGVAIIFAIGFTKMAVALKVILILIAIIDFVVGIGVVCMLFKGETEYECPNCKTRFQPEIREYMQSKHTATTRQLTCPSCEKTSDCKCKANVIRLTKK